MKKNFEDRKHCPKCDSQRTQKGGYAVRHGGKVRRYICTECGHVWVPMEEDL